MRGEFVQPLRDLAHYRRRCVQRQPHHSSGEVAYGCSRRPIPIRRGKLGAKQWEIREGVLQQRIRAFELLGEFLLPGGFGCQSIDGRGLCRILRHIITRSAERFTQRVYLLHQRIIVAQHPGPRAEDIALQRIFHHRKAVQRLERAVIPFRVGIDGAKRQPAEQH
ncbi:MAG TPA: hypothetical protein VGI28_08925 [Stellaceae bacterium]